MDLKSLSDEDLKKLYKDTHRLYKEFGNKSIAVKVLLNGGYGALTNETNRWYSNPVAESITLTGQLASNWVIRDLNIFMNNFFSTDNKDYIVAGDTDSLYLNVKDFVFKKYGDYSIDGEDRFKFLMDIATKIEKVIEESLERLYEELNVAEKSLHMKLESFGSAVWVAKKRYAISLVGNKGIFINPRRLKVQGLEVQRSSTPEFCRNAIKEILPFVIEGNYIKAKQLINEAREKFKTLSFSEIAFPRSVTDMNKYSRYSNEQLINFREDGKLPLLNEIFLNKIPIHNRAATIYNYLIISNNLENQMQFISSGDKFRFCYMKIPNPTGEDIIGAPDELPREFGLNEYIDFNNQFQRSFFKPIDNILRAAGMEYSESLDITQFLIDEE